MDKLGTAIDHLHRKDRIGRPRSSTREGSTLERPLVRVLILYLHPLLGEGLARLLSAEPGIAVTAVREGDACGIAVALAERPDVVVEERGDRAPTSQRFESGFSPLRLFVGLGGPSATTGDEPMTADPELIVRAVRNLMQERLNPVHA
jgi:hypothetical protein